MKPAIHYEWTKLATNSDSLANSSMFPDVIDFPFMFPRHWFGPLGEIEKWAKYSLDFSECECKGRLIHFFQDLSVPYHTSLLYQIQHLPYEQVVYENWNKWDLGSIVLDTDPINSSNSNILSTDPLTNLRELAKVSNSYLKQTTNAIIVGDYDTLRDITQVIVEKATGYIKGI